MESLFVTAAVIALVELIKRVTAKDWGAVATILGAAIIGGIAGFFKVDNLTIEMGVLAGLSAAGVYRLGQVISTQPDTSTKIP